MIPAILLALGCVALVRILRRHVSDRHASVSTETMHRLRAMPEDSPMFSVGRQKPEPSARGKVVAFSREWGSKR